jgi:RimJ/RimL family protein N-acetyltransferase
VLQANEPELRKVVTYNAEVNEHMIRVNELLGFRPTARLAELQKRLG